MVKIISGGTVTFDRADWQVPDSYPLADSTVVPLLAGETLEWQMKAKIRQAINPRPAFVLTLPHLCKPPGLQQLQQLAGMLLEFGEHNSGLLLVPGMTGSLELRGALLESHCPAIAG